MLDMVPYDEAAELLKVLANPHRLAIVHGLATKRCNVSTMQECLDMPQSTVSSHLKTLRAAGIVAGHRQGTEVLYTVVSEKALEIVYAMMGSRPPGMTLL